MRTSLFMLKFPKPVMLQYSLPAAFSSRANARIERFHGRLLYVSDVYDVCTCIGNVRSIQVGCNPSWKVFVRRGRDGAVKSKLILWACAVVVNDLHVRCWVLENKNNWRRVI